MIDLIEIYVHWYAGRSQVQIAESWGVDFKTVRRYLGPVTAEGLVPGGLPVMSEADWRSRAAGWFPGVLDRGLRQVTWPANEAHRNYIDAQLAAGVTVSTIHQRPVDEHQLVTSVASVRRWVAGNLPEEARRAAVRVLRPGPVPPGSEAQIDYGRLGMWTDPATGTRHTVQTARHGAGVLPVHVRAPGCCGWTRRRPSADPVPRRGIRLLQRGSCALGAGQPEDGGGQAGPVRPSDQPLLRRARRPLRHSWRPRRGRSNPRTNRGWNGRCRADVHVRDSFWRGRTFTSLEAMQAAAVRWSKDVAGACRPPGRRRTGRGVRRCGGSRAQGRCRPPRSRSRRGRPPRSAPISPVRHVKVGPALYSVPWALIGQQVHARSTATMVQVTTRQHDGTVVATHVRR